MLATSHTTMTDTSPRILPEEEVQRICDVIMNCESTQRGVTEISVRSWWNGELRWARNRVSLASDRRDIMVTVLRALDGGQSIISSNQTDTISLESMVAAADRGVALALKREAEGINPRPPKLLMPSPQIWSDVTSNLSVSERSRLGQMLAEESEAQSLLSAGYIEIRATETAEMSTTAHDPREILYSAFTQSQCSMTARHPQGVGSGWAGVSSYDWAAVNAQALAKVVLDKCIQSLNPVAIEPGRYTVVLEPQAVADIVEFSMGPLNDRMLAERGRGPFVLGADRSLRIMRSKLGLKVMDERISILHDPDDPMLGVPPAPGLKEIEWVKNGVLMDLSYDRAYSLHFLNENEPDSARLGYRMTGGKTSLDEMISTTSRGLVVTRFSNLMVVDPNSVLITGFTRDGLWLVEDGKISKAVKNLRFTESPIFALNQIEDLGEPVSVFRPVTNPYRATLSPAIVPPIKARDFSFTSTIDAI